jgi:rSAM/selenodomain-associated transferase 1
VKTRLVSMLGAAGAARLHAQLVERAVATALAARCGPVELHGAPNAAHPFLRRCASRFGVRLRAQARGDLGERMHAALARALRAHRSVLLIGADCPALRPRDLRSAREALRAGADAVIAPARDGGYALIGLRRIAKALFRGIAWGGPEVLAQTERRLARLGWRWRRLRTVWDVDRPGDLAQLRRSGLLGGRARRRAARRAIPGSERAGLP